jgi:hypothetical protein
MGTYCSYCREGPYKTELIDEKKGIGGIINGYWFCGWCYKLGMKNCTSTEKERMKKLTKTAENNNSGRIIDISK